MQPSNTQNQQAQPIDLSSAPSSQSTGLQNTQTQSVTNIGTEHYVAQAVQLTKQYVNDPYRLSEALNELKVSYLAKQYNIAANIADK